MTQTAGPLAGTSRAEPEPHKTAPFTVVDELSCYHDHRAEPNTVHLEAQLTGALDPAALRAAVAAVLAGSPRARARRAAHGRLARGYRWEFPQGPDHDPVSVTPWRDEAELARVRAGFLAAAPRLDRSPAFSVLLATGPGHDVLMLGAHHAAFDGQSCLALISGISDNYASSPGAPHRQPETAEPDVPGLAAPGQAVAPGIAGRQVRPRAGKGLTVTRIAAEPASERDGYGCLLLPLIAADSLHPARSKAQATVNDLLICALALTIETWNAEHRKPAGRITITMPVSTRPAGAQAELGNLSGLAVVRAGRPVLLRHITAQTRLAKQNTVREADPVSRALTTALLPVAVKRALLRGLLRTAGPAIIDTSLMSNLGVVAEPPRFGTVTTARMAFSTSAHMPRGLSAGAITVDGRLQVCLRYRRALLCEAAAGRFARCFSEALTDLSRC